MCSELLLCDKKAAPARQNRYLLNMNYGKVATLQVKWKAKLGSRATISIVLISPMLDIYFAFFIFYFLWTKVYVLEYVDMKHFVMMIDEINSEAF